MYLVTDPIPVLFLFMFPFLAFLFLYLFLLLLCSSFIFLPVPAPFPISFHVPTFLFLFIFLFLFLFLTLFLFLFMFLFTPLLWCSYFLSSKVLIFPELEFINLLRNPGIDSQPGGPVRQPYMTYRHARLRGLSESIPGLLKRLQIRALKLLFLDITVPTFTRVYAELLPAGCRYPHWFAFSPSHFCSHK